MYIKSVKIKNFRCFDEEFPVELAQPDGNPGSGLTILIGENGNGKTTILEAVNYLTLNKYTTENILSINDFNNFRESIEITADTTDFKCKSTIDFYKDWEFKVKGISFTAESRITKERNKLLSSAFEIKNRFLPDGNYIKPSGENEKEIDSRDTNFNNGQIDDDEINIFYFDKNRARQINTGNYKTTLERILDELNWRFIKDLTDSKEKKLIENISGEYFKNVEEVISANPGSKLGEEISAFFGNEEYKNLKLDLLNLLHPFENASFVLRENDSLVQKTIKSLGSGIEMIITILLLRIISNHSKGTIMYLIDEPEMHLHPKAQEKLLELLLEESKDKQIIISTHSPYMFKGVFSTDAHLLLCLKKDGQVKLESAKDSGWGLFGKSSPTWGEINYFAYGLPTVEFHNELYGNLQSQAIEENEENYYEENFDDFLKSKIGNSVTTKDWIKELKEKDESGNQLVEADPRCLQTYIRNSIHHPENTHNTMYTFEELKKSTDELVKLIKE